MIELFLMPQAVQLWLLVFVLIGVILQAVALVFCFFSQVKTGVQVVEIGLEFSILLQYVVFAWMFGTLTNIYRETLLYPFSFAPMRYGAFVLIAVFAVAAAALWRLPWPLLVIPVSAVTLPVFTDLAAPHLVWVMAFVMTFFVLRSIHLTLVRNRGIQRAISAVSMKEAIDSLYTGVMLCEPDGYIVLANAQMLNLMVILSGRVRRNGKHFYQLVSEGECGEGCVQHELDGKPVYILPNGSAWMFQRSDLEIDGKPHIQYTAMDINERWALMEKLHTQNIVLQERSKALKTAIANIYETSREREIEKSKVRIHDILGQRLSILLHAIQENKVLDETVLLQLSENLLMDLKHAPTVPTPAEEFKSMQAIFEPIGVDIVLSGHLPMQTEAAKLVVDIIREGVSNAVRHGYATCVHISAEVRAHHYHLEISNDGIPPGDAITEGSGIQSMRSSILPYGGTLQIEQSPQFNLIIALPGVM